MAARCDCQGVPGGDATLANQVFQREYESLSRLRHINIVELIDGGRDPKTGERYFVFP
jgi:serine/threonine protein kinase